MDINFDKLNKNKYKIKKNNKSMKELCNPPKFKLQPNQLFLGALFKNTNIKGLLVFHKIGGGKTCASIRAAEEIKRKMKIIVVLPASLKGNYIDELLSACTGEDYISNKDRKKLENLDMKSDKYKKIYDRALTKINKYYTIYSYHKFVDLIQKNKIKLRNTLLIIDEVQNMISENGTFYNQLKKVIYKSDDKTRIMLLSATPMFDKPTEISLTLNLLKLENKLPVGTEFNNTFIDIQQTKRKTKYDVKNMDIFKNSIHNMISYYRGASPKTYAEERFKVVRCKMSEFQYKSYLAAVSDDRNFIKGSFKTIDLLDMPNNFFIGPRMVSNIAFPNKSTNALGYSSFEGDVLKMENIKEYSIKFYKIFKKIKACDGLTFVYSNFKEYGGLKSFVKFIEYHGYKNFKVHGPGHKRFAIWSGDEKHEVKNEIKHTFNKKENVDGSLLKIILGSPAIKEGVSLKRVQQVHVMEPYWNISRMQQIIGRALRYCSHKDMPRDKRFVDVFVYVATCPEKKCVYADDYIWKLAKQKQTLITKFEDALKEKAIDCEIFYDGNNYPSDKKKIKCDI